MLRLLFRALGVILLAFAFASLVVDGTRSIAADTLTLTPLSEALGTLGSGKVPAIQAAAQRLHPLLWDPVLETVLLLPIWAVAGALGALALLLTRRRRAPIGYSSR